MYPQPSIEIPETPISDAFAQSYKTKTVPWGFNGLGYLVFKRTYARPIIDEHGHETTEEWWQTIQRVVNGAQAIGADYTQEEAERLFDYMFNLKGTVGGRMLWQLGTATVDRLGQASLVNCYYADMTSVKDFSWIFEMLMLGGGVGFNVSHPELLGTVREASVIHNDVPDADFIVPDKREGWTELLERTLYAYLGGEDHASHFTFSTQLVRPYGTPIKTFGGVASGPEILIEGIQKISDVLDGAVGRTLSSVEVLDICNIIGSIVVSGNVRRSAMISAGRPDDIDYLQAKRWDLGTVPNWRAMSNNSVFVESIDELPEEFWEGYKGNGEPYGLLNLTAARKFGRTGEVHPDPSIVGFNPCGEVPLAHRDNCNLAEIFLNNVESQEELIDIAILLYKTQKAVAALPHHDKQANETVRDKMRLGLGVTGVAQSMHKMDWLDVAYQELRKFDKEWSAVRGWPESIRLTTAKPSGTLSLLGNSSPGVHPGFSQYHIRRVRLAAHDPLVEYCKLRGYPVEPVRNFDGTEDSRTVVVEFPCEFSRETLLADDVSAIDQMEIQRIIQRVWSDNAVSTTTYFTPEELPDIQEYLAKNWAEMKSISFLLKEDHGFDQAPLEAISREEYQRRVNALNEVSSWHSHGLSAMDDSMECEGGACPIR